MEAIYIPNENDIRKWIKEALKDYFNSAGVLSNVHEPTAEEMLLTRKEIAGIFASRW